MDAVVRVADKWRDKKGLQYDIFVATGDGPFDEIHLAVLRYFATPYYKQQFGENWEKEFYKEVNR